jgi:hypothetical protein
VVCAVVNVCAIELPELALAPVMFGAETVHAYVVPVTPLGTLKANEVAVAVQIDAEEGADATLGIGYTFTV